MTKVVFIFQLTKSCDLILIDNVGLTAKFILGTEIDHIVGRLHFLP